MRRLFAPLLDRLESGDAPYTYKPTYRKILLGVGTLFLILASAALAGVIFTEQLGALIPVVVFFGAALVCFVVAIYGNDRAVAKLWGNR